MLLIAHRGNIRGPDENKENHPDYLVAAIGAGYNVELDIWKVGESLALGHDSPQYEISKEFLTSLASSTTLWTHAKNIEALQYMSELKNLNFTKQWNFFWHEKDSYTLTSEGYIWAYPGSILTQNSICVMPEAVKGFYSQQQILACKGVCSDYVEAYKT
tara:strand:+ start:9380 stop:9856 length:477 start_codon:yes stop_codon:yes gene_type:complete